MVFDDVDAAGVGVGDVAALLEHQAAVVAAARKTGADLHRHYEPGSWIPHLTLAPRLHLQDLATVAKVVYDVLPVTATLSSLTLVDTSTGRRVPVSSPS